MYEQWHPLGPVGVISAFNFPVAVWSWNALIAMVCGDTVIWKPSLKTPLTAIAVQRICDRVLARHGWEGVLNLVDRQGRRGGRAADSRSARAADQRDGFVPHGARRWQGLWRERMGRTLLELGGNNGVIVMDDADPELVVRAVLFGAVGTAGQRCTSIRRLFLQKGIAAKITERLMRRVQADYDRRIRWTPQTLMGPLIDRGRGREYDARARADSRAGRGSALRRRKHLRDASSSRRS